MATVKLVKALYDFVSDLPYSVQLGGKSEHARVSLQGATGEWLEAHE